MADPYADLAELKTINQERETAGLPRFRDIVEAREWKAEQKAGGEHPKAEQEQPKPEDQPTPEVSKDEPAKQEDAPQQVVVPVAVKKAAVEPNAEIAELKRQLQSMKTEEGRVAKLDRLLKESEARIAEAERKAQEAEQRAADIERKAKGTGIRSYLTPEQLEGADEGLLDAFDRMNADTRRELEQGTKAEVGSIRERQQAREAAEQEREASMLQSRVDAMWKEKITPVIPEKVWGVFASNPKWEEWCNRPYAGSTRGDVFNSAISSLDHEAAIEQMRNFMGFAGIEIPAKGNKPPLRADEIKGSQTAEQPKAEFYEGEYNRIVNDYAAGKMPTGWSDNKLREYIEKGREARFQGRMKPGFRPR